MKHSTMIRTHGPLARTASLPIVAFLLLTLLAPVTWADDTELLRENGANPFLFIILDNSRSMATTIEDQWTHAGADDPRSKLYIAKEVLYEVLAGLDNVNYGLATFNKDELRVQSKHYLYYLANTEANTNALTLLSGELTASGLAYPAVETDNKIVADDGTVSIQGDLLTLGRTYERTSSSTNLVQQTTAGGTCAAPLSLETDREKINRYPKLGADGDFTVEMWVEGTPDTGGESATYRLQWRRPALSTWTLGDPTIRVELGVAEVDDCSSSTVQNSLVADDETIRLELRLWTDFLWVDDGNGATFSPASTGGSGGGGGGGSCGAKDATEISGGYWGDLERDVKNERTCLDKPFSGQGWEGNYDTGRPFTSNSTEEDDLVVGVTDPLYDTFCNGPVNTAHCENFKIVTDYATNPDAREIDVGDLLPWNWSASHHDELLRRLNPAHPGGTDFGVAGYFSDTPDGVTEVLEVQSDPPPILASGDSPVGAAILDFRCWFSGEGANKCGRTGFQSNYGSDGFFGLLGVEDPSLFACRQPFLIVISDLYHNCTSNSDVSKIAGMFSDTSDKSVKNGVSSWLLNMGQSGSCDGFTNAGKGEEIDVDTKDRLREVLNEIIGKIVETRRAFAAAAVPTVQADSEDKIYFTQFTPLQDRGIWPADVLAFSKPLPTIEEAPPDNPNTPEDESLEVRQVPDPDEALWDAGTELLAQAPNIGALSSTYHSLTDLKLGGNDNQRRVVYLVDEDVTPRTRMLFGPPESIPPGSFLGENEIREDLWRALAIIDDTVDLGNRTLDEIKTDFGPQIQEAHRIFKNTYIEKEWLNQDGTFNRYYVLGDIFHSNPQVLSQPSNPFFLADPDLYVGYEDFAERHERRRKTLIVGANDGMLHIFDVGRFQGDIRTGEFDNGSGREVLAFIPRAVMPQLNQLADEAGLADPPHHWMVDGTPQLADVLIDVDGKNTTGILAAESAVNEGREWRTVVIGGLRRGGNSIYALDVTHPDPVTSEVETVQGVDVVLGYQPTTNDIVPDCWDSIPQDGSEGKCDVVPWGSPLWEFTDTTNEDASGEDLAETWSAPEIGPIRIESEGVEELRWVAIFGGGLSSQGPGGSGEGNWLYIVDVETGEAIYKRRVGNGSAVTPPASIDVNQDGVIDRVYIGTTEGLLWRVDMSTVPSLQTNSSRCTAAIFDNETCLVDGDENGDTIFDWDPVVFFDTVSEEDIPQGDGTTVRGPVRKPIFFAPSVFFVGQLGGYGLAFGTGNRDNLWTAGPPGGNRFYVVADEVCNNAGTSGNLCQLSTLLPITQADLLDSTNGSGISGNDPPPLLDFGRPEGGRGWFLRLGVDETGETDSEFFRAEDERMVTPPTSISGLSVFSTFVPDTDRQTNVKDDPSTPEDESAAVQCSRRGLSRSYLTQTVSGDSVPGNPLFETVTDLVSEPYLDRFQTQNEPGTSSTPDPCEGNSALFETLKETIFPESCKFSPNFRFNLMTNRADTGVECIVQIPVCIQQRNWKEF